MPSDLTETVGPLSHVLAAVPLLVPGDLVAERYEVREVLGRGGHAVVYLAHDRRLGRAVALKVLRPDRVSEVALERFRREAAVARDAASAHLVRIYDFGTAGDTTYLTLELVEGETLRDRLKREGPLPVDEALSIARRVTEGLQALHGAGVVHRDVKPSNILLGGDGEVKLSDFGLAFHWDRDETRLTETLQVVGTAEYLSPEQIRGERARPASDLYSVGVVLYEMLTGELPHRQGSSLSSLLARLKESPRDLRCLRSEAPPWLARLVARLLERRPADRPASAEAVLASLATERSARFGRRQVRRLAATALLAILLAASGAAGWLGLEAASPATRFSHLEAIDGSDGSGGVQAIAEDGSVLWSRPEARANDFDLFHVGPGRRLEIAGLLGDPDASGTPTSGHALRLVLLDPDTGEVLRSVLVPRDGLISFPEFKEGFGSDLVIRDLDGDGSDEILVYFLHRYWPSVTVLYEPEADYARTLFVAAGHHRLAAAVDLDSDGTEEALFVGTSNKMGHYYALAAVRIDPPLGAPPLNRYDTRAVSFTPDPYLGARNPALLWYALLPSSVCAEPRCVSVDAASRTIRIERPNHEDLVLDFDGFLADRAVDLPATERRRLRMATYELLSQSERLVLGGYEKEALEAVDEARQDALRVGDPWLSEWAARNAAEVLIRTGRWEQGEELARTLMPGSEMEPEIAYEVARTLQLSGRPRRAISWFREGLGPDPTPARGRNWYELMEGLVLAYAELGDWSGAREAVREVASDTFSRVERPAPYLAFIQWRSGGRPERLDVSMNSPDPDRYWALEIRFLLGDPLPELLRETRRELDASWETLPMLTSLEGEILGRMGRPEEALDAARRAFEQAGLKAKTSTLVRAHFALVTDRLVRRLREMGRDDEAVRATAEMRRILGR